MVSVVERRDVPTRTDLVQKFALQAVLGTRNERLIQIPLQAPATNHMPNMKLC